MKLSEYISIPVFIILLNLGTSTVSFSQELLCNVNISTAKIQGTNKQVFETLEEAVTDFMNNTPWTNHIYEPHERIECNILLNITNQSAGDEYEGTLQIQARRPVYNSTYNSVSLNYMDNDVLFQYIEFDPLEFSETSHLSDLTSILAFYAYIIIGLDYDSFSPDGGNPYFAKAEKIINNAQNARCPGWKSTDSRSRKNRYWLIENILDEEYSKLRNFTYQFHRQGLDKLADDANQARNSILSSLELLQEFFRQKPDPFMHYFQVLLDAKEEEIVKVFSEATDEEKRQVYNILSEIDAANSSKYKSLQQ